ncbi:MAG: hypothetical protein ACTTHI_04850 [Prevotella sp.]
MKRYIVTFLLFVSAVVTTQAMSYLQARQHALFLADKMAYELNLTEEQYEAVYEINLDYLMRVDSYHDIYGIYWERRNLDLQYILYNWQYRAFCNAPYFYRPLCYNDGYWRFSLYVRYPRRDYYYFGEPGFYTTYRGAHSWYNNGNRSWYDGRTFGNGSSSRSIYGMRDHYDNGSWVSGSGQYSPSRRRSYDDTYNQSSFGERSSGYYDNSSTRSFGNGRSRNSSPRQDSFGNNRFGNDGFERGSNFSGRGATRSESAPPSGSFGGSSRSSSNFGGNNNPSGTTGFGGNSPSRR